MEAGGTTSDRLFTLQPVNCVGACALAPLMLVDGKYYNDMTPDSALEVIHGLETEEAPFEKEPIEEETIEKEAGA